MKFGRTVYCVFNDGFTEPEDIVVFDEISPKIGSLVKLSDGKIWTITKVIKEGIREGVYCKLLNPQPELETTGQAK